VRPAARDVKHLDVLASIAFDRVVTPNLALRLTAAAGLLLALAACGPGADPGTDPGSAPAATAGLGERGADPEPTPVEKVTREVTASFGFTTPSQNIGCLVAADFARCDLKQKNWKPPAKPADCELAWGVGVTVTGSEKGVLVCAGDTVLGATEILPYGQAVKAGDYVCNSESTGVVCENSATGHGFEVSRQQYRLY
jgi:hypothetical protein